MITKFCVILKLGENLMDCLPCPICFRVHFERKYRTMTYYIHIIIADITCTLEALKFKWMILIMSVKIVSVKLMSVTVNNRPDKPARSVQLHDCRCQT